MSINVKENKSKLKDKLGLQNIHEVPNLVSVIVGIGIGSMATRKGIKDFGEIEKNLKTITGQKPKMCLSKKSISNFKLRENMPSMTMVTLRGKKAYSFLDKVAKMIMPRVRDFSGLSTRSFDKGWWYTIWLKTYNIFPELHPDDITMDIGMQITIKTNSSEKDKVRVFMESLWFVFQTK